MAYRCCPFASVVNNNNNNHFRRNRSFLLIIVVVFLLVTVCTGNTTTTTSTTVGGIGGKDVPEKGEGNCIAFNEKIENLILDNPTTSSTPDLSKTCSDTDVNSRSAAATTTTTEIAENIVTLTIFLSLPAYAPILLGSIITWAITGYLNDAMIDYDIKTKLTNVRTNVTTQEDFETIFLAELVQGSLHPIRIQNLPTSWWWQYDIEYYCRYGNHRNDTTFFNPNLDVVPGSPITNTTIKNKIQDDLETYMEIGLRTLSVFHFYEASHGILGMSLTDPRESESPFNNSLSQIEPIIYIRPTTPSPSIVGGDSAPQPPSYNNAFNDSIVDSKKATEALYRTPLTAERWDWKRYTGLSLFISTVVAYLFLSQIASFHNRRRIRKEIWGNLGTEEGIDALLQTAWKFQGEKIDIYVKRNRVGYRDDDSMFEGGYQQTELYVVNNGMIGDHNTTTHIETTTDDSTPVSNNVWH